MILVLKNLKLNYKYHTMVRIWTFKVTILQLVTDNQVQAKSLCLMVMRKKWSLSSIRDF